MTNEELVIRIKAGIDPAENMLALYEQVKAFINSIAWKYHGREEIEDLEQEGYLALYDAIDGYAPDTGYKFLTYAKPWIIQRIQRYIENYSCCLRLPSHIQVRLRQYKQFHDSFMKEHDREPAEDETAYFMGLSIEQVREIHKNAATANMTSLNAPVKNLEEGEYTVGDVIPSGEDMEEDTLERIQQEQLSAVLWEMVDGLPGRQPEVIRKRYQDKMSMTAAGEEMRVGCSEVRKEELKALRELRKPHNANKLRPFLPENEVIYNMGISGTGFERFNQTWTSATERAALRFEGRYK